MDPKELLKEHVSRITELTDQELDYFFDHFKSKSFKKGQTIIAAGDRVTHEYFVLDGCLKTFYINDDVKMHILQFAMPGWWASDYDALYNGAPANVSVDCIINSEVLYISNSDRERLCREVHGIEYFFRWRTNKGYVAAQKRLLSLMNNDAKARYEELLRQYPQLYNIVPKHLIAAYLGVTRETLSRLYHT